MNIVLTKKPKNVRIIEGFPGFGLIGTISIEFLLDHLETEKIGVIEMPELPAMIAIHQNKVIEPISLHYNKKHNMVLVHAINIGKDLSWQLAESILELATTLQAKEIISLEGVGSPGGENSRVFFYANDAKASKKLSDSARPLIEGIIVGATGALLAKQTKIPITALFAEARSKMPDSNAAAEVIKVLDAYTGLDIDPAPLRKQAQEFEKKLKGIMQKGQQAEQLVDKKRLSYVG